MSVSEICVIVFILSTLSAIVLPAIDSARESDGLPPDFPILTFLFDLNKWLFLVGLPCFVTAVVAVFLLLLRRNLPESLRRRLPITPYKREGTVCGHR